MKKITKNDVDWDGLRKNLVASYANERLWSLASCHEESIMIHESNMKDIAEDIVYIDGGYQEEVLMKHDDEWFNGFLK